MQEVAEKVNVAKMFAIEREILTKEATVLLDVDIKNAIKRVKSSINKIELEEMNRYLNK